VNTKEAIEFLENDVLTISIIDQKVDEYYDKIKCVVALLQQGEKYRQMWEELTTGNYYCYVEMQPFIKEIKQKYFPKEASQDYKEGEE
jgi:hypothetical protein